jgi:phage-related protein
MDTSKDSELCNITNSIEDLPAHITEAGRRVTNAVVKEVTQNLPKTIQIAYDKLMIEIQRIVKLIMENLNKFKQVVFEFLTDAYGDIKDFVIKTKEDIQVKLIDPVLVFLTNFIVSPIQDLIRMLIQFKDLLADSISNAVRQMTGVIVDLKNNVINVISSIPKYIEEFINAIMDIVNFTTDQTVNGANKAISEVVGTTNSAIGTMAGSVNASTASITDASKIVAKSVETGVNEVVKGINNGVVNGVNDSLTKLVDGLKTAINDGIIKPVNVTGDGISTAVNSAVNPIIGAINTTTDGINKARQVSIPKLEIPTLAIPEIDIKIAKIPGITIINKTQITPEIRPFSSIPEIGKVAGINLDIKDIPGVNIGYVPKIPNVDGVKFDLNYNIPTITGPDKTDPSKFISVSPNVIPKPNAINGGTPFTGKKNFMGIQKGGFLPQINIDPAVNTISTELKKPIDTASGYIKSIYDETMDPINKVIQDLIALSQSLVASVKLLFERYVNKEFIDKVLCEVKKGVIYTYGMAIETLKTKVLTPMIAFLMKVKDQLIKNIMIVMEIIKGFFKEVFTFLKILFSKVADILYETGKTIVKTGGYFLFYVLGQTLDKIPIPVSVTAKLNMIIFIAFIFAYSQMEPFLEKWRLVVGGVAFLGVMSLGFVVTREKEPEKITMENVT